MQCWPGLFGDSLYVFCDGQRLKRKGSALYPVKKALVIVVSPGSIDGVSVAEGSMALVCAEFAGLCAISFSRQGQGSAGTLKTHLVVELRQAYQIGCASRHPSSLSLHGSHAVRYIACRPQVLLSRGAAPLSMTSMIAQDTAELLSRSQRSTRKAINPCIKPGSLRMQAPPRKACTTAQFPSPVCKVL